MEKNQLNLRKSKGFSRVTRLINIWQQVGQGPQKKKREEGEVIFKVLKKEKLVIDFLLFTGVPYKFLIIFFSKFEF